MKIRDFILELEKFGLDTEIGLMASVYYDDLSPKSRYVVDTEILMQRVDENFCADLPDGGVIIQ